MAREALTGAAPPRRRRTVVDLWRKSLDSKVGKISAS